MTRSPAMNGRCLVIFLLLIALVPVSERPTAAQSATPTSPQGRLVGVRLDGTGLPLVTVDLATGALLTSTSLPFNFFFSSAFDSTTHRYFLIGQGPGPTFATQMVAVDTTGGALVPSAPISLSSPVGLLQFDPATGKLVGVRLDGTGLVTVDPATGALLTPTSLPFNFFFSSAFDSTTHRYFLIGQGP